MDQVINTLLPHQEEKAQDGSQACRQLNDPAVQNALAKPATLIAGQNIQILRAVSVGPSLQPTKQLAPVHLIYKPSPASTATLLLHKGSAPSILRRPIVKMLNPLDLDPLAITEPIPKNSLFIKPPPMNSIPKRFTPCFRLVDLDVLAQCLWCNHCQQPLSLKNCIKDCIKAFCSFLHVKCNKCASVHKVPLTRVTDEGSFEAYSSDVNISLKVKTLEKQCANLKKQIDSLKNPNKIPPISVAANLPASTARRIICLFVLKHLTIHFILMDLREISCSKSEAHSTD